MYTNNPYNPYQTNDWKVPAQEGTTPEPTQDAAPAEPWSTPVTPESPASAYSLYPYDSAASYAPVPPAPKGHRDQRLRGRTVAGLMAACMLFSAACGFGGGYLANSLGTHTADTSGNGGSSGGSTVLYQGVSLQGQGSGSLSVAEVAANTADSVVEINTKVVTSGRFGQSSVSQGAGSGVILSADGYIVTNNHVVEGASQITVRTKDGTTYEASLVGTDPDTDLAVIKIEASGLKPAVLGDSDKLVVGETAVAIGNPLGELGGTVTSGIISALSREITIDNKPMTLLQTNAAISPGNSGGGLFNSTGELIGIVNAKSTGTGVEGLGFAIPINTAKPVIEQLIQNGYVKGRVDVGFTPIDLTDEENAMLYRVQTGIYVLQVSTNTDGFQPGDRIVSMDGREIASMSDYNAALDGHAVGDTLTVVVERSGRQLTLTLTLGESAPTSGGSTNL